MADTIIQALAPAAQMLEHAVNGVAVVALEMLAIGHFDERIGGETLVIEQVLEDFAHVREGGDVQVNGQLGSVAPHAGGIDQHQLAQGLGRLQGEGSGDPAAEGMADQGGAADVQGAQETLEHLDEAGDGVVDERLVGAAEAEQIEGDDTMRGGERIEAERPVVGVTADAVDQDERRA